MSLVACFFAVLSLLYAQEFTASSTTGGNGMKVPESMKPFLNWGIKHGVKFGDISVVDGGKGRGRIVVAERDIKAGDEIMFIPDDVVLDFDKTKTNPTISLGLEEAKRRGVNDEDLSYLGYMSFILSERKNPQAHWKQYVDDLPESDDYLPIGFIELSREELQHTSTLFDILINYHRVMRISKLYNTFGTYSWDEWRWAFNMVRSRTWKTMGFVPFFDLCNHGFKYNTYFRFDRVHGGVSVLAKTDISVGDEIKITYGPQKANAVLFGSYGFFLPNNPSKTALLYVSLKDYHPDWNKKVGIQNLKPQDLHMNHPDYWDWHGSKTAFNTLRIYTQEYYRDPYKGLQTKVTVNSEVLVLKELIDAVHRSLGRMKSSLREDEDLLAEFELKGSDVDARIVNIVKVRIEERNVLLDWKNVALDCLMMLQTKTLIRNPHSSGYLKDIIYPLLKGNAVSLSL